MKKKEKRKVKVLDYVLIAVSMVVLVLGIFLAVCFWPAEKVPVNVPEQTSAEDDPVYKAGEEYLVKVAQQPDVKSLGGGIYYKVISEGTGPKPTQENTVRVHYEGRLVDGTVFDSSYERKEEATFPVSGVITGWQIALKAMPVGSAWEIYIPQYYAYGAQGSGKNIPPYSALIFKVELLGIVK